MMWNEVKGNWKHLREPAKRNWAELTDDDLDEIQGERERLEGILQERYGRIRREEAEREVDQWMESDVVHRALRR